MLGQVGSTLPAGSEKPGRTFKQRVLRLEICVDKGSAAAIWWPHCKEAKRPARKTLDRSRKETSDIPAGEVAGHGEEGWY